MGYRVIDGIRVRDVMERLNKEVILSILNFVNVADLSWKKRVLTVEYGELFLSVISSYDPSSDYELSYKQKLTIVCFILNNSSLCASGNEDLFSSIYLTLIGVHDKCL